MHRTLRTTFSLSLILGLGFLAGCTSATPRAAARTCYHASEKFESDVGYCQAVRSGNTLYISGAAATGNMADAIHTVYDKLSQTLKAKMA